MARSDALKRAQARYEAKGAVKDKTRAFHLKCHVEHDKDIIDALDRQDNKNGYLKGLIRKDIKEQGK